MEAAGLSADAPIPAGKEFVFQFWIGTTQTINKQIAELRTNDAGVFNLFLSGSNNTLQARRGSTVLATGGIVSSDTAHLTHVECKVVLSHTTTGSVVVLVDGVEVINETGVQTADSDVDVTILRIQNQDWFTHFARFVVMDFSGTEFNDVSGPLVEAPLALVGDGPQTDMIPDTGSNNFDRVNESVADGDTSYVRTETPGDIDLYEAKADNLPGGFQVGCIRQFTIHRSETGASADFRHLVQPDGATEPYEGDAFLITSESYRSQHTLWPQNPETAEAWTPQELLDGILVGQEHVP